MTALITGASSPLAKCIDTYFSTSHHRIILENRDTFCVTDELVVEDYFKNHSIDLLIYLAAINTDQLIIRTSINSWNSQLNINLTGAFVSIKKWLSDTTEKSKHVVLISSYSGIHPHLGQLAYSTSKAALIGLMQGMTKECEVLKQNRFNVILPGRFQSNICMQTSNTFELDSLKHVAYFIDVLHHKMPSITGQIFNLDNRNI
jgi:NAD(P)-dependent dehydrogenase (short-subunit alcohol dehydrogenase family)